MTTILIDPLELAEVAGALRQSLTTLETVAAQVHTSCCCCVASTDVAGEVDGAAGAFRTLLQSLAAALGVEAEDLAQRGNGIAADQSLASAAQVAWGAPAPVTSGLYTPVPILGGTNPALVVSDHDALYPSMATIGGGGPGFTITGGDGLYLGMGVIGGGSGPNITILDGDGQSVSIADMQSGMGVIGAPNRSSGPMGGLWDLQVFTAQKQEDLRRRVMALGSTPGAVQLLGQIDSGNSNLINSSGLTRQPGESEAAWIARSGQSTGPFGNAPIYG